MRIHASSVVLPALCLLAAASRPTLAAPYVQCPTPLLDAERDRRRLCGAPAVPCNFNPHDPAGVDRSRAARIPTSPTFDSARARC